MGSELSGAMIGFIVLVLGAIVGAFLTWLIENNKLARAIAAAITVLCAVFAVFFAGSLWGPNPMPTASPTAPPTSSATLTPPAVIPATNTLPPVPQPSATESPQPALTVRAYDDTGKALTKTWDFPLPAGKVIVYGGYSVNEERAVLAAQAGPSQVMLKISDGFYSIVDSAMGREEFCRRLDLSTRMRVEYEIHRPLPGWDPCP